jgi:hypothetical protein
MEFSYFYGAITIEVELIYFWSLLPGGPLLFLQCNKCKFLFLLMEMIEVSSLVLHLGMNLRGRNGKKELYHTLPEVRYAGGIVSSYYIHTCQTDQTTLAR